MNNLFTFFTGKKAPFHFPGIAFLLAAVFMLLSLVVVFIVFKKEKKMAVLRQPSL
jgi:MFS transporter, DHA1 family, tetracycline resistance protein